MTDPLDLMIDMCEVSFRYEERWILRSVNFQVKEGEFIGLIGPNGGGKTTLLKLIMGLLRPTEGGIRVAGTTPRRARPLMAYVPQRLQFDLSFPITLLEVVLGGLLSRARWWGPFTAEERQRGEAMLEQLGLIELRDLPFGELSGGQAQRGLVARALLADPKILLLDEPTANVDRTAEKAIYDLIGSLKGKMTLLMVTHHLPALINEVDRVVAVQREVLPMAPDQVCEHFGMGLYHPPLIQFGEESS